jgi:hypothetical protein
MSEVNLMLRSAAVQAAAERQLENSKRVNISGITATTGIPRGEVSRILNSSRNPTTSATHGRQNITNRILRAWHCDPAYLAAGRRPRNLMLFGNGPTFESLVREYGQGIPIRAILDELNRIGAIQLLTSSQKILPTMPLAINRRITFKKIRDFDAAMDELFHRLLCASGDASLIRVSGTRVWAGRPPPVRRRFGPNAASLLRELQTKFAVKLAKHRPKDAQKVAHLRVKIDYSESNAQLAKQSLKRRRNFHRNR